MHTKLLIFNKPNYTVYTPPTTSGIYAFEKQIENQEELDGYLGRQPEINTILTYQHRHFVSSLSDLIIIVDTEKNYDRIIGWAKGWPKCFKLLNLQSSHHNISNPYYRWDTINDFRVITKDEHDKLLADKSDYLQTSIQAASTRTPTSY